MKKNLLLLFAFFTAQIYSQSSSVFDATYFNIGNKTPLIELGKGFHITDVYRPTKQCFVNPNSGKLKSTQGGAKKTTISYYYTKNEEQYNTLKSEGTSGQVSYLNLFSTGGSSFSSFATKNSRSTERLVIISKVDFGVFTLSAEPVLKPEAKDLVKKQKFTDFINSYGTHYIAGIKRESSVWIVLTKKGSKKQTKNNYGTSFSGEFNPPAYGNFKYEVTDNSEIDEALNSDEYSITIELKGPTINSSELQAGLEGILSSENSDKTTAIASLITAALKDISDPTQGLITQYYYNPFSLYDVNVIQWNEKKLNQLVKINQNVITLYTTKSIVDKLTSPEGPTFVSSKFDKDIIDFKKKEQYKNEYFQAYNTITPTLANYKIELDTTLKYLEKIYKNCCDIYCDIESVCGSTGPYEEKVQALTVKIKNELAKMATIKNNAWQAANTETSKPECEKESIGYVTVVNISTNPYDFYNEDAYIERIPAKTTLKYKFKPGNYNLKAVQVSGYMMYATINNRSVNIPQICSEVTIKVGFAD